MENVHLYRDATTTLRSRHVYIGLWICTEYNIDIENSLVVTRVK